VERFGAGACFERASGASFVEAKKFLFHFYPIKKHQFGKTATALENVLIRNERHGLLEPLFSIERQFAKVEVAGSNPVSRSKNQQFRCHQLAAFFISGCLGASRVRIPASVNYPFKPSCDQKKFSAD